MKIAVVKITAKTIFFFVSHWIFSVALANTPSRFVTCKGSVTMRDISRQVVDRGQAIIQFSMVDRATMRNVQGAVRFSKSSKLHRQLIDTFESRARQRAIASGRYRADFFDLGHNGACQMGLGYQGERAQVRQAQNSWGMLFMDCGMYGVTGNLKCAMKQ